MNDRPTFREPGHREEQRAPQLLVARTSDLVVRTFSRARQLVSSSPVIEGNGTGPAGLLAAAGRLPPMLASFVAAVVIPSLFVILYLAFFASDQYVAELRLAVRQQQNDLAQESSSLKGALAAISSGSAPQTATQEAYIIAQYLRSRAAIDDLSRRVNLAAIFQRPEADFWARLKQHPSAEALQSYWTGMVSTAVDSSSGIVTVKVRAFRPEDAKQLADAFLAVSEELVNNLSTRARQDALKKSEDEVRRTEGLLRDALVELRQLRDREGFMDPLAAASSTSKLLLAALAERGRLQSDLFVLNRAMSTNAPTVTALKDRLDSIDAQIDQMKGQLTSKSAERKTISASLVKFEELELQRIFAEKLHELAQNALERARQRAEQQQLYLSVFLPAYLPEEARYPERLLLSAIIPTILLVLWSIVALTVAAINDKMT